MVADHAGSDHFSGTGPSHYELGITAEFWGKEESADPQPAEQPTDQASNMDELMSIMEWI
jgi:hypothetical protein